jgi:hypothetical protein
MQVTLRKRTTDQIVGSPTFDPLGLPRTEEVLWLSNGEGWKIVRIERFFMLSRDQESVTLIVERFEIS